MGIKAKVTMATFLLATTGTLYVAHNVSESLSDGIDTIVLQSEEMHQLKIAEREAGVFAQAAIVKARAANQIAVERVRTAQTIERDLTLAWVWNTSMGLLYGLMGVVPTAVGGLILWRVVTIKRREDEDRKLVNLVASGAMPVSREFLLNNPQALFEMAQIAAENAARVKMEQAQKVELPSLTTYTNSPTYSPTTTNDKDLVMTAKTLDQQKQIDQQSTELTERDHAIKDTLESLGVPVAVSTKAVGPQAETYAVKPLHRLVKGRMKRVTVREITKFESDVAMALGVESVRMEQKAGYIACEVARVKREFVSLTDLIGSQGWKDVSKKMILPVALGRNTVNEDMYMDMCEAPHMFVGGATKMGKSVLVRSIIYSLCQQAPSFVKLIMIDPKKVEFRPFAGLPHIQKIITDMSIASTYLESAIDEMERRNDLFAELGVQNIKEYNNKASDAHKLHYIVIIIDEVADLVMTNKDEVTDSLVRLAGKARSAGIHLLLATQRPDAETIPPLVRANVMARISVKTRTSADSKVILDEKGAEKLLNCGDAIIDSDDYMMVRFQSAFIEMDQAYSDIMLAQTANCDRFPEAETSRKPSENQAETSRKPSENQAETKEERAKRIIALHLEGLSVSDIQVQLWGSKGGRRNKERREEIKRAIASRLFSKNGHLNGHQGGG